jgi:hypothetical protein
MPVTNLPDAPTSTSSIAAGMMTQHGKQTTIAK